MLQSEVKLETNNAVRIPFPISLALHVLCTEVGIFICLFFFTTLVISFANASKFQQETNWLVKIMN